MKCREARRAVLGGRTLSAPTIREHLKSCGGCRALAAELSRSFRASSGQGGVATEAELDTLLQHVERVIAGEKGLAAWMRGMPTRWRVVLASSAAAALAVAFGVASPRLDLDAYPQTRLLLSVGAFLVLLGTLIVLNLRPLQRPELSTRSLIFAFVALAVPFLIALLPEAQLSSPVVRRDVHDCLLVGCICGAALMALLRVLDRSTSDARSLLVPAAAGGVLGNVALFFHCPAVSPLHLALVHAPTGFVLLFGYRGFRATKSRIARARAR
ncbi:MAG TPA: NrsF family protein [Polyangiaceae bacterium]|nr:NrsF family protein [Polyangiaceae bacterium]